MRTRLRFAAAGVLVVVCLSGCGPVPDGMPTSTPTPSLSFEVRMSLATGCMDLWLNTEAPQDMIDQGMSTTDIYGTVAVTQDQYGTYYAHPDTDAFAAWAGMGENPWPTITGAIQHELGCPYDPAVKVKIAQAEQECLTMWVRKSLRY